MQIDAVRNAVREVAPLMIDLVAPPKPDVPPPPPPPVPPAVRPVKPLVERPVLAAPTPVPLPADAFTAPAPPPEAPPVVMAAPAPPAPPAPPVPPAQPPAPKVVSASAVAYLVQPPVEMPRLSVRAREQGTVWLRVVVDARGQPAQITVSRSSGFARLDEQALDAMKKARFKPHVENGVAIAIQVTTPLEYILDN